jgi:hypothetical protein
MDSSRYTDTPPKHKDENSSHGQPDDDLTMFDSSSSNEEEDDESSNTNDCCDHIKKVSINIQMLVYLLLVS